MLDFQYALSLKTEVWKFFLRLMTFASSNNVFHVFEVKKNNTTAYLDCGYFSSTNSFVLLFW